jgi:hypothetical protein
MTPAVTTEPTPSSYNLDTGTARLVIAAIGWGFILIILAIALPIVTPQAPPSLAPTAPTSSSIAASSGVPPAPGPAPGTITEPRVTLVHQNGYRALLVAAIPALASGIVGLALILSARSSSRWPARVAWTLSVVVLSVAVVGFLTLLLGLAIVPVGVLLIAACARVAPRPLSRRSLSV